MKTLLKYLKNLYPRMCAGLITKFFGTLFELMLPFILSHILSNVIGKTLYNIFFWGILMICCSGLACFLNILSNRIASKVSRDFAENLRKDLFKKTLYLSASQTDYFTIPSLESRITTDTYNVHSFINVIQKMGIRTPIILIGGILITLFMDAYLSLVMIGLLPFIFFSIYFIRKKGVPLYTKIQQSVDNMIRIVREDIQGIRVIKALSKIHYEHNRYSQANRMLFQSEIHTGMVMGFLSPIMCFSMNIGNVAIVALGALLVSKGISSPENIIAFMQYFTLISLAMMSISRLFMMYTKCSASAQRIEEILLSENPIVLESKTKFPDRNNSGYITFDNVSFSYNKRRNNLENICFTIKKGAHFGILGATGSGKSTLVKLLLRFYDTDKGDIYIGDENIRTIPKESLYPLFGSALQQDFLYQDTIEENIRFGRELTFEQIQSAAKIAQAHEFISGFAAGYNHKLSPHGTNLSGGQKQRILIARAIAANPEILILDDSSSALDYKTDSTLRRELRKNLANTTTITIAQRVSSVKDCDCIIILENGKISGMGTHDQLLDACAEYKEIADSQMGGALVD